MTGLMQSLVPTEDARGRVQVVHVGLGANRQDRRRERVKTCLSAIQPTSGMKINPVAAELPHSQPSDVHISKFPKKEPFIHIEIIWQKIKSLGSLISYYAVFSVA